MNEKYLYAVLLGGKIRNNHFMEEHHLVFVIAENEPEARILAKKKWDAEELHVDGTQKLTTIDGYKVVLEKSENEEEAFEINPKYSE